MWNLGFYEKDETDGDQEDFNKMFLFNETYVNLFNVTEGI